MKTPVKVSSNLLPTAYFFLAYNETCCAVQNTCCGKPQHTFAACYAMRDFAGNVALAQQRTPKRSPGVHQQDSRQRLSGEFKVHKWMATLGSGPALLKHLSEMITHATLMRQTQIISRPC